MYKGMSALRMVHVDHKWKRRVKSMVSTCWRRKEFVTPSGCLRWVGQCLFQQLEEQEGRLRTWGGSKDANPIGNSRAFKILPSGACAASRSWPVVAVVSHNSPAPASPTWTDWSTLVRKKTPIGRWGRLTLHFNWMHGQAEHVQPSLVKFEIGVVFAIWYKNVLCSKYLLNFASSFACKVSRWHDSDGWLCGIWQVEWESILVFPYSNVQQFLQFLHVILELLE